MASDDKCKVLKSEISYIHNIIQQDFSGYVDDLILRNRIEKAYEKIISETCLTRLDYVRAIKKYFAVMSDPHIQPVWDYTPRYKELFNISTGKDFSEIKYDFADFYSTGVLVKKLNNKIFVVGIDDSLISQSNYDLKIGDELISCDDYSPMDIIDQQILPYESVTAVKAARYKHAEKIFYRWDKASGEHSKCVFRHGGSKEFKVKLKWFKVDSNYFVALKKKLFTEKPLYTRERTHYGHFLKLTGMVGDTDLKTSQLKEFVKDAKELRGEDIIVLDLRGNGGGTSSWGTNWIKNLYGYPPQHPKSVPDKIVASVNNYMHYQRFFDHFEKTGSFTDSNDREKMLNLLKCLKNNLGKFVTCNPTSLNKAKINYAKYESKFRGQLYVIIDWTNFSSAEIFIQQLKLMPNVTLLGLPTDASTNYGDIRFDITPEGMALKIPTKVFGGLFIGRKPGEAIFPDIHLKYNIDQELQGIDSILEQVEEYIIE